MTEDLEPTGLTAEQEKAAMLDAKGETRAGIARACGVTGKTVSVWRGSPLYRAERDRIRQEAIDELAARETHVKRRIIDAASTAVGTLTEALTAERADGTPEWGTRTRAAEAILGKVKFSYDAEGEGTSVAAAAVITVHIGDTGEAQVIEGKVVDG